MSDGIYIAAYQDEGWPNPLYRPRDTRGATVRVIAGAAWLRQALRGQWRSWGDCQGRRPGRAAVLE